MKNFQSIAVLSPSFTTYIDSASIRGIVFYRLKTTDTDGRITYSNIAWVNGNNKRETNIYPTVFTNNLQVQHDGLRTLLLQLLDASGKLHLLQSITNGTNHVNASGLPAGVYFYRLINGPAVSSGRLVKQY